LPLIPAPAAVPSSVVPILLRRRRSSPEPVALGGTRAGPTAPPVATPRRAAPLSTRRWTPVPPGPSPRGRTASIVVPRRRRPPVAAPVPRRRPAPVATRGRPSRRGSAPPVHPGSGLVPTPGRWRSSVSVVAVPVRRGAAVLVRARGVVHRRASVAVERRPSPARGGVAPDGRRGTVGEGSRQHVQPAADRGRRREGRGHPRGWCRPTELAVDLVEEILDVPGAWSVVASRRRRGRGCPATPTAGRRREGIRRV